MTKLIIALNIIVFVAYTVMGDPSDAEFMYRHGAVFSPAVTEGHEYYRLLTAVFLHFDFGHIFNNMILLYFLGDALEKGLGKFRYMLVYLASGILGNVATVWIESLNGDYSVSAGASGAVFGILGAFVFEVLSHRGRYAGISGKRLLFFILLSLYSGFATAGVNNIAHVAGMISGFFITFIVDFPRKKSYNRQVNDIRNC